MRKRYIALICILMSLCLTACNAPAHHSVNESSARASSAVPTEPPETETAADADELIKDMITCYGCYGRQADEKVAELLDELQKKDSRRGKLWKDIMDYLDYANHDLVVNTDGLPDDLPDDDSLCFVVLGYQLNPDGSMQDELLRRLALAYALCLAGYASIWSLFGAANQLLSAVVLTALAVFLRVTGRKGWMLYAPMVFMFVVTMSALIISVYNIFDKFSGGNFVFMVDGLQLIIAISLMILAVLVVIAIGWLQHGDVVVSVLIGGKLPHRSGLLIAAAAALLEVEKLTAVTRDRFIHPIITAVALNFSHEEYTPFQFLCCGK